MNAARTAVHDAILLERRAARALLGVTFLFVLLQPTLAHFAQSALRDVCGGWGMTPVWMFLAYAMLTVGARLLPVLPNRDPYSTIVRSMVFGALALTLLGLLSYEVAALGWARRALLDVFIADRACAPIEGIPVAGAVVVAALAITLLAFEGRNRTVAAVRDATLLLATVVSFVTAVTHLIAGSGFGTFVPAPRTNAFASLMLFFIACSIGLYRREPSPYQWLVRHAHRRVVTRVLMIATLFPAAVLLGDSFFSDLGVDEQVSETAAIGAATVFVAATVARFSMREERETRARLDLASELVRSEAHYRLLAENSVDIVAKFDADNRIEWISPSVTAVLGWDPNELLGLRAEELAHSDDLASTFMGRDELRESGITAYRIRIRCKDGTYRWIGVRGRVVRDEFGAPAGISASLRDIDHEVRVEQRLDKMARRDALTDLLNRSEVYDRIEWIAGNPTSARTYALLFCDMDNLKELNDDFGHAAGDAVLQDLALRMTKTVRSRDLVARIGGDEFLIVLPDVPDSREALATAERIREAAELPLRFGDVTLSTSLSIGVALALPGEPVDSTVMRADRAMYRVKASGRNGIALAEAPEV